MINKTKTKILTLSVASVVGLAAITVLASNANNALDFQGEVKQNAHLELKELKLIENPTKPGVTSKTDVTWKMDDNELVATKEAKGTTNTVKGQWTLSIWGQSNSISESESFILWGTKNALGAKTSIIGASNRVKITEWEGNVVLSSSNWTVKGTGNIILSSNPYSLNRVNGSWNIALSVEWSRIKSNGSMAIGKNIQIENEWTFVFNAKEASAPFKSKNDYTTLIFANNGMIINTNKRNTQNVGVTVNWGIKVGQTPNLDKPWSLITQDNCLQLKSTGKGAISLKCRGIERDGGQVLETPKCWRNAKEYQANATTWLGQTEKDFCENGKLQPVQVPVFFTDKDRANAQWNGSYAKAGFWNYNFTICFWENDPFCAPQSLSKTWRCSTPEGNASVCEATQVVKKDKKAPTKTTCPAWRHHEGGSCVSNTKTVDCDDTGINKNNGSIEKSKVTITWSNGKWSSPEKCQLKCNPKFELKKEWHNIYCAKSNSDNKCKNYEYYNPTTKKCESRCIGTYEVEDLHADCSYKSNVWKCRRFWHAAIWIGGDDMWAARGKRGPWQENVTEEFCETSYGPFDVKISYEFQSYGGRQCNESKCKQWSSLCEWESRSYNKKCSDSFNESDPRYFAGTCERIDPSCSWKSD